MRTYPLPYRARLVDVALDHGGRGLTVEFATACALLGSLAWAAVVAAVDVPATAGVAGYGVLAVVLSWFATPTSGLLVGGLCVLFADGFALAREGRLSLTVGVLVVLVLAGAACAAIAVAGRTWRGRQRHVISARPGVKDSSGQTSGRPLQ